MTLVNVSLITFGGLFVVVPLVLHLIMRQRPKQQVFPALQLLRARRAANRRQLQLRHWLLLLLRCAAILLLAAALARPSVASAVFSNWLVVAALALVLALVIWLTAVSAAQRRGILLVSGLGLLSLLLAGALTVLTVGAVRRGSSFLLGDQEAPVAAVLVFDTSPRMQYRQENSTRLEQAQELAVWLVRQLPEDSEVAVVDSRVGASVFAVDLGAALKAIDGLRTTNVPLPIDEVLSDSLELARRSDRTRKEIYVFTDLTRAGWETRNRTAFEAALAAAAQMLVYVLDVGVEHPQNFALGDLQLSKQTLARHSQLHIRSELTHVGPAGERAVEMYVEQPDRERPVIVDGQVLLPEATRRSRQTIALDENGSQWVEFTLGGLDVGNHHGWIKISGEDGLPLDDVRYFTVEVSPAWPVLVAVGASATGQFLADALAPYEFRQTNRARFRCDAIDSNDLAAYDLRAYDAVCLLDPGPLPAGTWQDLAVFVRQGGGLAVFLGRNAQPVQSFNEPAAQAVLPGALLRQWRSTSDRLYLAPRNMEHPALAAFRPIRTAIPWNRFPVQRHWVLGPLNDGASSIMSYGNGKPAILERRLGQGRVLTMTTPISDAANLRGRPPWNQLPIGLEPWPFVILSNEMLLYLVQSGDTKLNYLVGQPASVPMDVEAGSGRFQLFTPRGDWQEVTGGTHGVTVKFTDTPGIYRLKARGAAAEGRGFSVNLPEEASRLDRLPPSALDDILGRHRYQLARNREEIDRGIGQARAGREFYPFLMILLVVVLGLEYTLANRFYRGST